MISDLIVSFKENLKSKTTNPFFGTLIVVWIIHNWRLLYTFFNFPKEAGLGDRIRFLASYLDTSAFLRNLLICIGTSILVLILTYLLLNMSRLIVNFYEKVITPWVYKITDQSSVVLKSDYNLMIEERNKIEQKYEMEHESRLKLQNEVEKLEAKVNDLQLKQPEKEIVLPDIEKRNALMKLLNDHGFIEEFASIIDSIINRKAIQNLDITKRAMMLNLIEKGSSSRLGGFFYSLTDDGNLLRQLMIDRDLSLK